jgi:hypothetical protein
MTDTASMLGICGELATQLAAFLGLLLAASGAHKFLRKDRARAAAREFAGVPGRLAPAAVAVMAGAELLAGLALWVPEFRGAGAALAALIWGGYWLLMLRAIARGAREVDCGCTFGAAHRTLGAFQILRSAALAAAAALVAVACAACGADLFTATQILAAFALLALYVALDQAMALKPPRAGELL